VRQAAADKQPAARPAIIGALAMLSARALIWVFSARQDDRFDAYVLADAVRTDEVGMPARPVPLGRPTTASGS
jgi:hypothetical protein